MKKVTVTELQTEIDLLTAKLEMVEKSLGQWHNEAMTLTDENAKLSDRLATAKLETSILRGELKEAWKEAQRYHNAYHHVLQLLADEKEENRQRGIENDLMQ